MAYSEEQWLLFKAAVDRVAETGEPFTEDDVLFAILRVQGVAQGEDAPQILSDMTDLGYLEALGGDPPRWRIP